MYDSNIIPYPVMNQQFTVKGGWIRYYILAFLLIHTFMITPIEMLLLLRLRIPPKNTLEGVILIGLFMSFFAIIGFVLFIITSKSVTVSGRQLVIRKVFQKNAYSCSDIVAIRCEVRGARYRHYVIELVFRDQTKFEVKRYMGNFNVFAVYLLQMLDAGLIPEYAITPEYRNRLYLYAQGKVWR